MDKHFQWQYPSHVEPVSTDAESVRIDKWFQPLSEPVLPRIPSTLQLFVAPVSTDPETTRVDKWLSVYPDSIHDFPRPTQGQIINPQIIAVPDQWTPIYPNFIHEIQPPLHTQAVYPIDFVLVVPDQWTPALDLPPADFARLQYMYPSVFIDPDFSSVPPDVVVTARTTVVMGIHGFFVEDSGNITNTPFETD